MNWSYHSFPQFIGGEIFDSLFQNAIISNCNFSSVYFKNNNLLATKLLNLNISESNESKNENSLIELIILGANNI